MNYSLNEFDAVIFDMDGVLIDSEPLWKIAMEEVFHALGSQLTKKDFQRTVGLRIDEVIHYWNKAENWGIDNEKEVEEAIISKMEQLIAENAQPLKGVVETLEYLKNRHIKIGLATSSSSRLIRVVLKELGIAPYFQVAHSAEKELYGKPHPAVYLHAAKALQVSPERCLVIEDSFNGIIAGLAAKMKVVCIPEKTHEPHPKLFVADFHFEDMSAFLKAFR
jgi:mannitol-1-/sugar-/sorbitol-6-/2-deoxyglucose-6-phosphatase